MLVGWFRVEMGSKNMSWMIANQKNSDEHRFAWMCRSTVFIFMKHVAEVLDRQKCLRVVKHWIVSSGRRRRRGTTASVFHCEANEFWGSEESGADKRNQRTLTGDESSPGTVAPLSESPGCGNSWLPHFETATAHRKMTADSPRRRLDEFLF